MQRQTICVISKSRKFATIIRIEVMSCILHIETSTSACSVAVSEDGQNVFKKKT